MKKQALLATVSLALVALASCGGTTSAGSENPSTGTSAGGTSVGDSTSVGTSVGTSVDTSVSTSTEPPEPTLYEQWQAITNWQGGVESEAFFLKTATITAQTFSATSREVISEDLSGELGTMFGMEDDWGYLNQVYSQDCSIYSNDVRVCSIVEDTDHTVSGQVVSETISQTATAYFEGEVGSQTYYNVFDDGSGTYELRNNYYTSTPVQEGATFRNYAGFGLSTTSGIGQRLTLAYYNSTSSVDEEVKYFTNPTDDGVEYTYWGYWDYTPEGFVGHSSSVKITAKFNGETLTQIGLEQGYFYNGSSVYLSTQYLDYGYEDNGEYTEALPDHTQYKLYGTLEVEMNQGNVEFGEYWNKLVGSALGSTGALAWELPTSSVEQTYLYDDISYARTYEMIEQITTNVYSDGYVVRDYSKQEVNVEAGGVERSTATSQISHDSSNIYEIVTNYENESFKITTPITETVTWDVASDISEWNAIVWMNRLLGTDTPAQELGAQAYRNGNIVELYVQGVRQQAGNTIGYIFEADIVFEILLDDDQNEVGVRVLQSARVQDGFYNWEELFVEQIICEYGYEEAITTAEANYTPLNPNDYDEYVPPVDHVE